MPSFAKLLAEIFRDFVTDGVPASGVHQPTKADIRAWGTTVEETLVDASESGPGLVELATAAEGTTGTDAARVPSVARVVGMIAERGPATAAAGDVGTYALLKAPISTIRAVGVTVAGSSLLYTDAGGSSGGGAPAGTWRLMGAIPTSSATANLNVSVWLRIS